MARSALFLAVLSLHGANAASILRGGSDVKAVAVETKGVSIHDRLSGVMDEVKRFQQSPQGQAAQQDGGMSFDTRVIFQLIFGVVYYFIIVQHYPTLKEATNGDKEKAKEIQDLDEVSATMEVSLPNCLFAWCCTGPRGAHTFHSAGILNYWAGCILMSCFPCCTLWIINSFTDFNERLEGEKRNCFLGALCACFCSCCVVAQDAQALDYMTGMKTELCSVVQND